MFPTNSVPAAAAVCAAIIVFPAFASAETGDYLSRRDTVTLSAGNAARANIAIQTPTPWPPYINDTAIPGYGPRAVNVIEQLNKLPLSNRAAPTVDIGRPSGP